MIFLTESENYKVYSIEENVYIKDKRLSQTHSVYEKQDEYVSCVYGNPTSAIILNKEQHIIISGCGITIYDIKNKNEIHLFNDPENITWTNALHQEHQDDQLTEFRYVAYNKYKQQRVFKMHIEKLKEEEIN